MLAAGNSAGAATALALAALDGRAYADASPPDAFAAAPATVDGALAFSGTVDAVEAVDPGAWAAGAAPLMLAHYDGDPTNDVRNSDAVAAGGVRRAATWDVVPRRAP